MHGLFGQDTEFTYPLNFFELRRKAVTLQFETADTEYLIIQETMLWMQGLDRQSQFIPGLRRSSFLIH